MIYLGRDVASRTWLWGSPENAYLLLAPPRRGKGVSVIIPNLLDWPGPLVATSTTDALIVHTACALQPRRPVYVFDPTGFTMDPGCQRGSSGRHLPCPCVPMPPRAVQGIQHADYFQSYNEAIHRCYLPPRPSPDATSPPSGSGSTGRRATTRSGVCATAPQPRSGPTTSRPSPACTTRRSATCSAVRGAPTTAWRIRASCARATLAWRPDSTQAESSPSERRSS